MARKIDPKSIAGQVKAARGTMKQDTLASMCGVSTGLIRQIEQGLTNSTGNVLLAICQATGCQIVIGRNEGRTRGG